jgi:acetyltransferase-like isoleucine patch superfamily enzyme
MISRIKKALKNILKPEPDYVNALIQRGIIKVGVNCDIKGLRIMIFADNVQHLLLEIGNETCIRGTLIFYTNSSKIEIGDNVYIGQRTIFECAKGIKIGNNVLISSDCHLIDTNSHSLHSAERMEDRIEWQKGLKYKNWDLVKSSNINIANYCWLGLRSIVMKGVNLGEGTVVSAGSVVVKSTSNYDVIGGNPAIFIKKTD